MNKHLLRKIIGLYKKSDQLLKSGKFGGGLWPIDPQVGQLLYQLIRTFGLRSGVEVGAGIGFSTAWLAAGFRDTGGNIVSLEYFFPKVDELEKNLMSLFTEQYNKIVQIVPSDHKKWIRNMGRRKFDFVFLDHRKGQYLETLQVLLPHLKNGAFICADNVVSHAKECRVYLEFVKNDSRFSSVTLQLAQGLEISRLL